MSAGSKWIICGKCRGEGKHSGHLGAILSDELEQMHDDEREALFRGDYDKPCEECAGTGKVLADRPAPERDYAWESEAHLRAMGG